MKKAIQEISNLIKSHERTLNNQIEFFKSETFKNNSTSDGKFEIEQAKKNYNDLIDELKLAIKVLENLHCSFCGTDQAKVNYLIRGTNAYICEKCVQVCTEILDEKSKEKEIKLEKETETPDDQSTAQRL